MGGEVGTGPRTWNLPFETLASCAAGLERRVQPGSLIARLQSLLARGVCEREIGTRICRGEVGWGEKGESSEAQIQDKN